MTYLIGASGSIVFVLVFLLDGWTRPGYSSVRHPVSALALGTRGWIQTTSFLVCGAAITVGGVGMSIMGDGILLGLAVTIFGLALVASGVFPMDPMRSYPPGTPEGDPDEFTLQHHLHDYAGVVVFAGIPAAAFIAAFVLPGALWTILSGAVGVALTIGFFAFGTAWENDSSRAGLVQKSVIALGWCWLAAVFLHFT